ncbi:MAG TPA: hypothetical protein VFJ77_00465 [Gaiellaceae bacterium]|nr:hypothetical protein [Gaiellaceae bacterium]
MTGPDFDELVGHEPQGAERDRLRQAHELLLAAGPPPELSPELEAGPTLAMTLGGRRPRQVRRRAALLLAATVAVLVVFLGGYIVGNSGGGSGGESAVRIIQLQGTGLAPNALASLSLLPEDTAGNWPMSLTVHGLPALDERQGYYAVYLVRNGKPWAPCGWFTVANPSQGVTVTLNAPYQLQKGDSWVVTRRLNGANGPGVTMLRPAGTNA